MSCQQDEWSLKEVHFNEGEGETAREREVFGGEKEKARGRGGTAGPDIEREGKWEEKREERRNVCLCLWDVGSFGRVLLPVSPATRRL